MNRTLFVSAFLVSSLGGLSCAGDESIEPPATLEEACAIVEGCGDHSRPGASVRIWRISLERNRTTGTITFLSSEEIEVPEDGVPAGPLDGEYVIAGRNAAGDHFDGQFVRFSDEIEFHSDGTVEREDLGLLETERLTGESARAQVYVGSSDALVGFDIVDLEGNDVAAMSLESMTTSAPGVGARQSAVGNVDHTFAACAHVTVTAGGIPRLATGRGDQISVEPQAIHLSLIGTALARMTPELCNSVHRITLIEDGGINESGYVAGHDADRIFVNIAKYPIQRLLTSPLTRLKFQSTIVHEAAHVADNALSRFAPTDGAIRDWRGRDSLRGSWLRINQSTAEQAIEESRLIAGLQPTFEAIHARFVNVGWAQEYPTESQKPAYIESLVNVTPDWVAERGSLSRYGSTSSHDDIAEIVMWTTMRQAYLDAGIAPGKHARADFGCQAMALHDSGVPSRFMALYTKLRLLENAGLAPSEGVESCLGPVMLEPVDLGMRFQGGGVTGTQQYGDNVSAVIGDLDGATVFEFSAGGSASFMDRRYPAIAQARIMLDSTGIIEIENVSWPRGVYPIAPSGQLESAGTGSFTLRLQGDGGSTTAGDFDAIDGYVFVFSAKNDRIEGAVFVETAMRINAPVAVPQTFDPPLQVRFRAGSGSTGR